MATQIAVTVKGPMGLDEPADLLQQLSAETGLAWQAEESGGAHLSGGIVEIVLIAALTRATDLSVDQVVAGAKKVLDQLKERRLSPPQTSIEQRTVPEEPRGGDDAPAED